MFPQILLIQVIKIAIRYFHVAYDQQPVVHTFKNYKQARDGTSFLTL